MKEITHPEEYPLRKRLAHELCKSTVPAPLGIGLDVVEWVKHVVEQTNKDRAELGKIREGLKETL